MSISILSKCPLVLRFTDIKTGVVHPDVAYNKKPYTKFPRNRVFANLGKENLEKLISIFESNIAGYDRRMDNRIRSSDGVYTYTFVMDNNELAAKFINDTFTKTFEAVATPSPYIHDVTKQRCIAITLTYKKAIINNTPKKIPRTKKPSKKTTVLKTKVSSVKIPQTMTLTKLNLPVRRNPTRSARYTGTYN